MPAVADLRRPRGPVGLAATSSALWADNCEKGDSSHGGNQPTSHSRTELTAGPYGPGRCPGVLWGHRRCSRENRRSSAAVGGGTKGTGSTSPIDGVSGRLSGIWQARGVYETIPELVLGVCPHLCLSGAYPFPGSPLDLFRFVRGDHPVGGFAGEATQHIAERTGEGIGGLLKASSGDASS